MVEAQFNLAYKISVRGAGKRHALLALAGGSRTACGREARAPPPQPVRALVSLGKRSRPFPKSSWYSLELPLQGIFHAESGRQPAGCAHAECRILQTGSWLKHNFCRPRTRPLASNGLQACRSLRPQPLFLRFADLPVSAFCIQASHPSI